MLQSRLIDRSIEGITAVYSDLQQPQQKQQPQQDIDLLLDKVKMGIKGLAKLLSDEAPDVSFDQ